MTLENIVPSKRSQRRLDVVRFLLCEVSRTGKYVETESGLMFACGWSVGMRADLVGMRLLFGGDENVLELDSDDGCKTQWLY